MVRIPSYLNTRRIESPTFNEQLGGSTSAAQNGRLSFIMQPQTETEWCWAAVSTSVSIFFQSQSSWTQCKVANSAWSRADCCGSESGGICNHPWYLDRALSIVDVFDRMTNGIENFSTAKSEIDLGTPLCLRVGWSGGGGHFLVIVGWQRAVSGNEYYYVDDSIYGRQTILKSQLESNYQGSGSWTHSYFVTQAAGGGAEGVLEQIDDTELLGA